MRAALGLGHKGAHWHVTVISVKTSQNHSHLSPVRKSLHSLSTPSNRMIHAACGCTQSPSQFLSKGRTWRDLLLSRLKTLTEMHSTGRSPWATEKWTECQRLTTFILSSVTIKALRPNWFLMPNSQDNSIFYLNSQRCLLIVWHCDGWGHFVQLQPFALPKTSSHCHNEFYHL